MKSKAVIFSLTLLLSLAMVSCSLLGSSNDAAVDALSDQVAALSTQNALLLEKMEEDEAETVVEEAVPAAAEVPTEEPTAFVIPSATPESLPTEPVEAGVPIIYDGWSMYVSEDYEADASGNIYITTYVRNLEENDRVFRYTNYSVRLFDNFGNEYKHDGEKCLHDVRNLTIDGEDQYTIESFQLYTNCATPGFARFIGPIPINVGHLVVLFENFGPFTGVEVIIEL